MDYEITKFGESCDCRNFDVTPTKRYRAHLKNHLAIYKPRNVFLTFKNSYDMSQLSTA